jgi:BASS family bile acid:Na+ symporter
MHRISTFFMMLMAALLIVLNITEILRLAKSGAIPTALIFIAGAFLAGYLFGGPGQDNRRALGLMSGARNASISLMIATQVFNDPKVLLMIIAILILMLIVFLPAPLWFVRRAALQPFVGDEGIVFASSDAAIPLLRINSAVPGRHGFAAQ